MSLGTLIVDYASLQAELGNWLFNRADVTSELPTFIALAEAEMNRKLHTRLGTARIGFAISAETGAVPADFNGAISFLLNTSGSDLTELAFVTPDGLDLFQQGAGTTDTGTPQAYTVEGSNFRFYPVPDTSCTAELTYRQKIPALSNANATNWVVSNHPDAYLYGALMQAYVWLRDLEKAQAAEQKFQAILADMEFNSYAFEALAPNLTPQPGNTVV